MESANRENSNEMKLVFDSRPANEGLARVAVAAFCTQLNPTLEEVADLKTAVSEAVTNCILHAYDGKVQPEETEGKSGGKMMGEKYQIELRCRLKGQELSVDVSKRPWSRCLPQNRRRTGPVWALPLWRLLWMS